VGQCIQAGACSNLGRHSHHQRRIHDGHGWHGLRTADDHLVAPHHVGDDDKRGYFRPGARGGGDGDDGRRLLPDLADAFVVTDRAGIRSHHRRCFGHVHRAATAQVHHAVARFLAEQVRRLFHRLYTGIGLCLVEQCKRDSARLQNRGEHVQQACLLDPLVGRNQYPGPVLDLDLFHHTFQSPDCEQNLRWDLECHDVLLHNSVSFLLRLLAANHKARFQSMRI
jgi:hypothetical protein